MNYRSREARVATSAGQLLRLEVWAGWSALEQASLVVSVGSEAAGRGLSAVTTVAGGGGPLPTRDTQTAACASAEAVARAKAVNPVHFSIPLVLDIFSALPPLAH